MQRAELNAPAEAMSAALTRERLNNTVDTTGTTIGKRCALGEAWGAVGSEADAAGAQLGLLRRLGLLPWVSPPFAN